MIRLTCTSCRATLEMDDAFAGGVCRCQHCGTIQTVPSRKKLSAQGKPAPGNGEKQKTLYATAKDPATGTGLSQLADVVASSGAVGSGIGSRMSSGVGSSSGALTRRPKQQQAKKPTAFGPSMLISGGILLVIVILTVALLVWRQKSVPPANAAVPQAQQNDVDPTPVATVQNASQTAPAQPSSPNFCGVALHAETVVYLLDRGNASRESFGYLKQACYKSIESLGPDRKFQVLLWDNGSGVDGYPIAGTLFATKQNVASCKKALEETYAFGQTDARPALKKALNSEPHELVLATAKGWELDDAFASDLLALTQSQKIPFVAININDDTDSAALKSLAERSGGTYLSLTQSSLKSFAQ